MDARGRVTGTKCFWQQNRNPKGYRDPIFQIYDRYHRIYETDFLTRDPNTGEVRIERGPIPDDEKVYQINQTLPNGYKLTDISSVDNE